MNGRWSILAVAVVMLVSACDGGRAAPALSAVAQGAEAVGQSEPNLNPHVSLPAGPVKVAPNLPAVSAPPGWLSQEQVLERIREMYARDGQPHGYLTVTGIQVVEDGWQVELSTDDRLPGVAWSHPAPVHSTDDPVQRRKEEPSWVHVTGTVTHLLDGVTGEVRGGGYRGGKPDLSRPDLEHYRGRIISGGEQVRLRLVKADGSREGRDLTVWVPGEALGSLALWQLTYGMGRMLDVWGLSSSSESVIAYRLEMADPPPESLLAADLTGNIPLYPGSYIRPGAEGRTELLTKEATAEQVIAWYAGHLPDYGWTLDAVAEGPGYRARYQSAAWEAVRLEIEEQSDATSIVIVRE